MISRRAVLAAPVALAAALGGLVTSASAVVPPYEPVSTDDPLVVADVSEEWLYSVEVGPRTITWAGGTPELKGLGEVPAPTSGSLAHSRAYTPDLGKTPLTLGAAITPPIVNTINPATTEEWAVGFDPYAGDGDYVLRVRHKSGAEATIEMPWDLHMGAGWVSVWGSSALVGQYYVDLATLDVVDLGEVGPEDCFLGERAVLADGLLLVRDACADAVVATEVPADGLSVADLEDATWEFVMDGVPDLMAYSRGLLVFSVGETFGYYRIDEPGTEVWTSTVPDSIFALRVQGQRYVVGTYDAIVVLEEGGEEPVAVIPFDGMLKAPVAPLVVPRDDSGETNLDGYVVDLYGRTLAWTDGADLFAATLPPLAGGVVTSDAAASATVGTAVTVTASGLQPGEEVAVWLESDPVLLALGYATADGTFSASVTIPAATAPGAHTLTVQGVESGWSSADPITVAAAGGSGTGSSGSSGNRGLAVDTGR